MDIYLWVLLVSDCEGQHRIFNRVETKEAKVLEGNTSAVTWGSLKTRVFFFFFFLIILAFLFFYWDHVCLLYIMCQIMYKKIDKMNQENTKTMTFSVTMSRVRTL